MSFYASTVPLAWPSLGIIAAAALLVVFLHERLSKVRQYGCSYMHHGIPNAMNFQECECTVRWAGGTIQQVACRAAQPALRA